MGDAVEGRSSAEAYSREKRVLLTRSQDCRLDDFLRRLEIATGGVRITSSELTRGLLGLALECEADIMRSAALACSSLTKHPATGDRPAKDALEALIATIVSDAIRNRRSHA